MEIQTSILRMEPVVLYINTFGIDGTRQTLAHHKWRTYTSKDAMVLAMNERRLERDKSVFGNGFNVKARTHLSIDNAELETHDKRMKQSPHLRLVVNLVI